MKKIIISLMLLMGMILVLSGCSNTEAEKVEEKVYNYYTAEETKLAIENKEDIILLDIQVQEEWNAHHIEGALASHAYPVKTDEERSRVEAMIPSLTGTSSIIVICPGGAGGAKRTIDYLETREIDPARLFILENGQSKWPYEELLEEKEEATVKFEDTSYFVDSAWLKENISKEDILILDARGDKAYKEGHIPGAIVVTWQGFSNMNGAPGADDAWGTVLKSEELAKKLSEYGISSDKEIVVYANTNAGWGEDGRIVWMLRAAGLNNSKILDGGISGWKASGNELSKDAMSATATEIETLNITQETVIATEQLKEEIGKTIIIDTREQDEYDGAAKFGEARGGHLKGAVKITFNEFINKEGLLKTPAQIKEILDANGIAKDDAIVTYCTAGIRSAHMQIVLDAMGYKNTKNYDSSFYAWAGNEELELVK